MMIIKISKNIKIHYSTNGVRFYIFTNNKWITFKLTAKELDLLQFIFN